MKNAKEKKASMDRLPFGQQNKGEVEKLNKGVVQSVGIIELLKVTLNPNLIS